MTCEMGLANDQLSRSDACALRHECFTGRLIDFHPRNLVSVRSAANNFRKIKFNLLLTVFLFSK